MIEAFQKLSHEHKESYDFAETLIRIANEGDHAALMKAIEQIKTYYNDELEAHLQHEEQTLFAPIFQQYREHVGLATQLLKEHGFFRMLIQRMSPTSAKQDIIDFAETLERHSRIEEETLLPLIMDCFTDEQLNAVLNHIPLE